MPRRVRPRSVTVTALAAAGLLSAANGALTGVGSAAPAPAVPPDTKATASVSVTCPFADPLGPRQLTVETSATLPAQAKTGAAATIREFSAKLTLPRDVALSLVPDGGSLQGGVKTAIAVHQSDRADTVPVALTVAPTALPETGDVTLTATGAVPDIAINTVGPVTLDVTAPALTLAAVPAPDAAETPAAPPIACTLDAGQPATLGKILVLPKTVPGKEAKPKPGPGGVTAQEALADPLELPPTPLGLVSVLTKSTVAKLGAEVVSDPAFLINGLFILTVDSETFEIIDRRVTGSTLFKPATTTFLGFGFVPVTATVEFLPLDYRDSKVIEISGSLYDTPEGETYLRTSLTVMARLSDAKVNGVPLDLGPDCVTAKPVSLELSGPYDPFSVGHIRTDPEKGFELPAFRGCGAGGQQLSPLLTGMGSGGGNQAFVDTYNLVPCTEPDHTQCPPGSDPPVPGSAAAAAKKAVKKPN